jgi:hypothetical protein
MTPERINRHDDERLYQPKIHSRRIRELYRISEETGAPMTVLVDQALREFVADFKLQKASDHSPKRTSDATTALQGDWFRDIQP